MDTFMPSIPMYLLIGAIVMASSSAIAGSFPCPAPSEQVASNIKAEVDVGAQAILRAGAAQLKIQAEKTVENLYSKYPNAGRVAIASTLLSTACNIVANSTQMTDEQKFDKWLSIFPQVNSIINNKSESNYITKPKVELKTKMRKPDVIECNSGGGESCPIDARLDADPGYIVCKILGNGGGGRSIIFKKSPENPLLGSNPPKYNSAHWWGSADSSNGGMMGFGGWNSNVYWSGIGIVQITQEATAEQRWENHCEY